MKVCITEGAVKAQTRSPKRVPKPVASGEILGAVRGLDSTVGALHKPNMPRSQLPAPKKLVKQKSLIKPPGELPKTSITSSHTAPTIITTPTRTYAESSVTIHDSPEAALHPVAVDSPRSTTSHVLPQSPITVPSPAATSVAPPPTDDARMLQEIRHMELHCQDELMQRRCDMHKRLAQTVSNRYTLLNTHVIITVLGAATSSGESTGAKAYGNTTR